MIIVRSFLKDIKAYRFLEEPTAYAQKWYACDVE